MDTGWLNAPVKLCFDTNSFDDTLKDHGINSKEKALELGLAETHFFQQDKAALIVMVFDFDEMEEDTDFSNTFATICHEAVHCVQRIWTYVGEDEPGEECVAYLTEHIVKQVLKGWTTERDKRALRKTNRGKIKKASEGVGGRELQVALEHLGRLRPDSLSKQESLSGGTKDSNR